MKDQSWEILAQGRLTYMRGEPWGWGVGGYGRIQYVDDILEPHEGSEIIVLVRATARTQARQVTDRYGPPMLERQEEEA